MGIRFSKSIKLGNYLRLNLSKSGVSASVGKKGASVTVGKRGTYLNLSPTLLGIKGTGLSYRQKLDPKGLLSGLGGSGKEGKSSGKTEENPGASEAHAAGGAGAAGIRPAGSGSGTGAAAQIAALQAGAGQSSAAQTAQQISGTEPGTAQPAQKPDLDEVLLEYERHYEERVHLHWAAEQVLDQDGFELAGKMLETEAARELYDLCLAGDEDTIESFIASFMNHLELPYDARVNFELQDDTLMADLDLPEIEDFPDRYPEVVKGKLTEKRKLKADLREEYAAAVLSLGLFLSAGFFNVSPCIKTIIMSAFTTIRNRAGDLTDQYLYSVKFAREVFEKTDLTALDTTEDLVKFLLNFENRINLSPDRVFKAVKPYEDEPEETVNEVLEEALLALKELGFKDSDIAGILPELEQAEADSASELVKLALKLFSEKN